MNEFTRKLDFHEIHVLLAGWDEGCGRGLTLSAVKIDHLAVSASKIQLTYVLYRP